MIKKLIDQSLEEGWDKKEGGLFLAGYYFGNNNEISIIDYTKEWWCQAESMNSLLLVSELFPKEKEKYYGYFLKLRDFIKNCMVDHEFGGWFAQAKCKQDKGLKDIDARNLVKSHNWKSNCHNFRALKNCYVQLSE